MGGDGKEDRLVRGIDLGWRDRGEGQAYQNVSVGASRHSPLHYHMRKGEETGRGRVGRGDRELR